MPRVGCRSLLEEGPAVKSPESIAWLYLLAGGVFECVWAVSLSYSDGFTRVRPSVVTVIAMGLSLWLLAQAMKTLPAGTAYAVWTGIGAAGVAVAGMLLFDESRDPVRLLSLVLIVAGVAGLKLFGSGSG
nr:quaternary ammonium compound efflux SMR transporter SugE [Prosthecochloris ethylica]